MDAPNHGSAGSIPVTPSVRKNEIRNNSAGAELNRIELQSGGLAMVTNKVTQTSRNELAGGMTLTALRHAKLRGLNPLIKPGDTVKIVNITPNFVTIDLDPPLPLPLMLERARVEAILEDPERFQIPSV